MIIKYAVNISKLLLFLAISTTLIITFSLADATVAPKRTITNKVQQTYGNFLVIDLTPPCLNLAKVNLTSQCPTYKELEPFDTTNQKSSGKFFYDGLFYHRGEAKYKNYQFLYPSFKYPSVVCVDCSDVISQGSKIIHVKSSNNFAYVLKSQHSVKNFTRSQNEERFVDSCFSATISWNPILLNDTIKYLQSGCKASFNSTIHFNETKSIYMKPSKLTYDGQWFKHLKFVEQAKKDAKEKAESYCKKAGSKC